MDAVLVQIGGVGAACLPPFDPPDACLVAVLSRALILSSIDVEGETELGFVAMQLHAAGGSGNLCNLGTPCAC